MKKKKPDHAPTLTPDVILSAGETQTLEVSRDALEALAVSWEQQADAMTRDAGTALARAGGLGDAALVLVTGTVAQVRADALRDCAAELRALAAGGFAAF